MPLQELRPALVAQFDHSDGNKFFEFDAHIAAFEARGARHSFLSCSESGVDPRLQKDREFLDKAMVVLYLFSGRRPGGEGRVSAPSKPFRSAPLATGGRGAARRRRSERGEHLFLIWIARKPLKAPNRTNESKEIQARFLGPAWVCFDSAWRNLARRYGVGSNSRGARRDANSAVTRGGLGNAWAGGRSAGKGAAAP